ncbi:IL-1 receptor-like protein [Hypsugopox virus]|nr:IL-1 receptor-like protein [Hypsugopox virus]
MSLNKIALCMLSLFVITNANNLFDKCTEKSLKFSPYLHENELYAIKCESKSSDTVQWAKAGSYYSLKDWKVVEKIYTKTYTDHIYVDDDNNLWFNSTKVSDSSVYVCFVTTNKNVCTYQATIIPDIDVFPSPYSESVTKLEGDDYTLTCDVDIVTFPNIEYTSTWYVNNTQLTTKDNITVSNLTVTFASLAMKDNGLYKCNVNVSKNGKQYTSIRNTELIVKTRTAPTVTFKNTFGNTTTIKDGTRTVLQCIVNIGENVWYANYKMYWKVNNESIETKPISGFTQEHSFPVDDTTIGLPLTIQATKDKNGYKVACYYETNDYETSANKSTTLKIR